MQLKLEVLFNSITSYSHEQMDFYVIQVVALSLLFTRGHILPATLCKTKAYPG